MNKKELKRLIDVFNAVGESNDQQLVRITPISTGVWIMAYSEFAVCNVIIGGEVIDEGFCINKKMLDLLKVLHKGMNREKQETSWIEIYQNVGEEYKEPERNTNEVMDMTMRSFKLASFSIDFKLLESTFKAIKGTSNIIRVDIADDDTAMISNEEGDMASLGLYIS